MCNYLFAIVVLLIHIYQFIIFSLIKCKIELLLLVQMTDYDLTCDLVEAMIKYRI